MRVRPVRATLLFGAALAQVGSPLGAAPLQPLHNWNVDYGETRCTAARDFRDASDPVVLGIVPDPSGETYELLVNRPRSGPDFAKEMPGSVDFGSGPIKAWLLYYGVRGSKSSTYQYRITAGEMAQARNASMLKLHAAGGEDFTVALRSMPALLDGLANCTADLRRYWNMDGTNVASIATAAKGDIRTLFSGDDYPGDALQNNQEGTAQYTLLIDEKGAVAACYLFKPSGVPVLDAMGCQAMRERARFKPAFDQQGKPVRSTVRTPPITWRIG